MIGSVNMQAQGIELSPNDLDIVVQLKDLKKISKIFSDYSVFEIRELKLFDYKSAWEVKVEIKKVEVQFLGEKDDGIYIEKLLANKLINIKVDNIEIPCFTLNAEAQIYSQTNRKHKTKIFKIF